MKEFLVESLQFDQISLNVLMDIQTDIGDGEVSYFSLTYSKYCQKYNSRNGTHLMNNFLLKEKMMRLVKEFETMEWR